MTAIGYVPNLVAQSMRRQSTMVVGCMVPDLSNPVYAQIAGSAERVLIDASYTTLLTSGRFDPVREEAVLGLFQSRRVDGVLCSLSNEADKRVLKRLRSLTMPVVLIERTVSLPLDAVVTDHYEGGMQAMKYLLQLGHRRIGIMTVSADHRVGRERSRAYRDALEGADIRFDDRLCHFADSAEGYAPALRMLALASPPTALLVGTNFMESVLRAVRSRQRKVPEDLSLISFGDVPLYDLIAPPMTAIRWDVAGVGRTAASTLLARLGGSPTPVAIPEVGPSNLVIRESCAVPARRRG